MEKAQSCAWAKPSTWLLRPFPPALSPWIFLLGLEVSRAAGLQKSTGQNLQAQKLGGTVAFIDMEHALDPSYAARLGVDVESLLVSQPDMGEQALEIAETLVRSGAVDLVIIDSVAALVPRAEIEGDMGDASMGMQARLMSQALRKLSGAINQTKTAVIFTNQLRQKIGIMFGNPETTPGGRALKFYASVRLDIRRTGSLKDGEQVIGNTVKVKVVKNKVAAPFRLASFEMVFGQCISREGELIDLGESLGVLDKSGAWYSFGEVKLGNGRERVRQFLKENRDIAERISQAIRAQLVVEGAAKAAETPVPVEDDAPAEAPVEEEAVVAVSA